MLKIAVKKILFCLALSGLVVNQVSAQQMEQMWNGKGGNKPIAQNRGKLFREGKYAMFIHWGIYSQLANTWQGKTFYGIGEWLMNKSMANIPVAD